jgi:hypothetical protein
MDLPLQSITRLVRCLDAAAAPRLRNFVPTGENELKCGTFRPLPNSPRIAP